MKDNVDTRNLRWGFMISKREENWLKRRYGSVGKGLRAILDHARQMDTPPPPVYPKTPRRTEKRAEERAETRQGKTLDLTAATEHLQTRFGQP